MMFIETVESSQIILKYAGFAYTSNTVSAVFPVCLF